MMKFMFDLMGKMVVVIGVSWGFGQQIVVVLVEVGVDFCVIV